MDLDVFTFPQNQYFHLSFQTFMDKLKMLQITFCPQIQPENFLNFLFSMRLSNGEYFKDFKTFDLTWIWWIWLEWPNYDYEVKTSYTLYFLFSGHYVDIMLLIWSKNWNYIYWLLIFLIRIKFGLGQISMAKISKAMLAIDCINNPCKLWLFGLNIGSSKISRSGRNYLFHGFS